MLGWRALTSRWTRTSRHVTRLDGEAAVPVATTPRVPSEVCPSPSAGLTRSEMPLARSPLRTPPLMVWTVPLRATPVALPTRRPDLQRRASAALMYQAGLRDLLPREDLSSADERSLFREAFPHYRSPSGDERRNDIAIFEHVVVGDQCCAGDVYFGHRSPTFLIKPLGSARARHPPYPSQPRRPNAQRGGDRLRAPGPRPGPYYSSGRWRADRRSSRLAGRSRALRSA